MNGLLLFHIVPIFLFLIISILWISLLFHYLFVYILVLFQAYKPILEMLQGKEKGKHLQAFNLESWWKPSLLILQKENLAHRYSSRSKWKYFHQFSRLNACKCFTFSFPCSISRIGLYAWNKKRIYKNR